MEELKTELFDMVNANGEKVRFEIEQKQMKDEWIDTRKDNMFMYVLIACVMFGAFAWWFI